jgi:aldose 1-epimerase
MAARGGGARAELAPIGQVPLRMERIVSPDGRIEVEVLPEAGGRVHRLRVDGADLLWTPENPVDHLRDPVFWGAYPMAPWCNRLEPGVFKIRGRRVVLASNFRDRSVIHGEVYHRPWRGVGAGRYAIRSDGVTWPWPYEVSLDVAVTDATARFALALSNLGDAAMPGGLGFHPWFRRPVNVAIHADRVYRSNQPSPERPASVAGRFDVRRLGQLPVGLDATWSHIGEPSVELAWPEIGLAATMQVEAPSVLICAASPSDVEAVAVEPQTHAPQGLTRLLSGAPDAMAWIAPGEPLRLTATLAFRRAGDAPSRP